jgi:hypothetical protein
MLTFNHNQRVFTWHDGRSYRGEWRKSKHHGNGVEIDALGQVVFDGNWDNNCPIHEPSSFAPKAAGSSPPRMTVPVELRRLVTPTAPYSHAQMLEQPTVTFDRQENRVNFDVQEMDIDAAKQTLFDVEGWKDEKMAKPTELKRSVTPPSPLVCAQMLDQPSLAVHDQKLESSFDVRSNNNFSAHFPQNRFTTETISSIYGTATRPSSIRVADRLSSRGDRPAFFSSGDHPYRNNGPIVDQHQENTKYNETNYWQRISDLTDDRKKPYR